MSQGRKIPEAALLRRGVQVAFLLAFLALIVAARFPPEWTVGLWVERLAWFVETHFVLLAVLAGLALGVRARNGWKFTGWQRALFALVAIQLFFLLAVAFLIDRVRGDSDLGLEELSQWQAWLLRR